MATTKQITVKVNQGVVDRAEAMRPFLSEQLGRDVARADVYRHALSLGLSRMAAQRRANDPPGSPAPAGEASATSLPEDDGEPQGSESEDAL